MTAASLKMSKVTTDVKELAEQHVGNNREDERAERAALAHTAGNEEAREHCATYLEDGEVAVVEGSHRIKPLLRKAYSPQNPEDVGVANAREGGFEVEEDHRRSGALGGEAEPAIFHIDDVRIHRPTRDKAALRLTNPLREDGRQPDPEGAGDESVVRVHNGERARRLG